MKKLLILLFSFFLLSSTSVFAEENLSKININNLNRLSSNQIIDAFSNKRLYGYYSMYGINIKFEEVHYADGDYVHTNTLYNDSGKWKVYDNKSCYKLNKTALREQQKMFTCVSIFTRQKGEYYFYIPDQGVYAKATSSITLID